jgi:hypothetical protein
MKKLLQYQQCVGKNQSTKFTTNKYPMKITFNDYLISYLTLLSGLSISIVAIYYSVAGLTAIYPASVIPIIVMGVFLELGKLSATVWLKHHWRDAPVFLKLYILPAVAIIMLITSVGVFGFLSKAHSDQNLVSGDVQARIEIYDEKIKTAKENIESDRKQLKQMDAAVDQIMARSEDEKGADKSYAIRKGQQRDRINLTKDIETNQKIISQLNDEAAPIRAEVRKVEAEVGPIKYIAAFLYGSNPDGNLLEKAVTWVTVLIVIVLDPLALVLLLASQYSFQRIRESKEPQPGQMITDKDVTIIGIVPDEQIAQMVADDILKAGVTNSDPDDNVPIVVELGEQLHTHRDSEDTVPVVTNLTSTITYQLLDEDYYDSDEIDSPSNTEKEEYVQNEEQQQSGLWTNTVSNISQQEYVRASQERLENHIDEIVDLIKSGHLTLEEVPKTVREQVRVKLQ